MSKLSKFSPIWLIRKDGKKKAVFYGYKPKNKVKVRPEYESCILVDRSMIEPRAHSAEKGLFE